MPSNTLKTLEKKIIYLNSHLGDTMCHIDKCKKSTNSIATNLEQKCDSMIRKSEGVCDELQLMMNKCNKTLEAINALTKD